MSQYNTSQEFYCKFCNKLCKNLNSLKQHEIRCKNNPNRIRVVTPPGYHNKGRKPWNYMLTKDTDDRVKKHAELVSETMKGISTHSQTDETKLLLRELALERGLGGFNMRNSGVVYNGIKLDSSYEVEVAKSLDEHLVQWVRPKRIPYHYTDGSLHYYTPDFYLPDYDVYLDPKNDYLIEHVNEFTGMTDVEKIQRVMNEHDIKIIILDKNSLTWNKIKELI